MINEDKFPTMRLMKCRKCGNVFPVKVGFEPECPDCASKNSQKYDPIADRKEEEEGG
jgi:predicted Zn-ribbon and HTH transcriptional regulator